MAEDNRCMNRVRDTSSDFAFRFRGSASVFTHIILPSDCVLQRQSSHKFFYRNLKHFSKFLRHVLTDRPMPMFHIRDVLAGHILKSFRQLVLRHVVHLAIDSHVLARSNRTSNRCVPLAMLHLDQFIILVFDDFYLAVLVSQKSNQRSADFTFESNMGLFHDYLHNTPRFPSLDPQSANTRPMSMKDGNDIPDRKAC